MKIDQNKFLFFKLFFCFGFCFAGPPTEGPPTPPLGPPRPPGMPLDNNIVVLVFVAVLFGLFVIYRYTHNKKGLSD